ncbi:MAG: DUF2835 family protein [Shewanellaceae bacterium]|nr:DUF2835 family protein [Shewanellaceae bacterium]
MQEYRFYLQISYLAFKSYYDDVAHYIEVTSECGQLLRIHARHFIGFLTHQGIQGLFVLNLSAEGTVVSLSKQIVA